jgi:hypothetical protein
MTSQKFKFLGSEEASTTSKEKLIKTLQVVSPQREMESAD